MGLGAINFVISVLSIAASQHNKRKAKQEARKARREAERRADAAKGFVFTVEGSARALPVCYGRNLIGGVRVYHNLSDYMFREIGYTPGYGPFSNIGFYIGPEMPEGHGLPTEGEGVWNSWLEDTEYQSSYGTDSYLITQQAMCVGQIHAVKNLDVDEHPWDWEEFEKPGGGLYVRTFKDGGPDLYLGYKFGRYDAFFSGMFFASGYYLLNREKPQFNGPPDIQTYINGNLVSSLALVNGVWELSEPAYSNNAALCLLDYLVNKDYGLGLSVDKIDLLSFAIAAKVCDRVVASVPARGRIWRANEEEDDEGEKLIPMELKDLKLYEANISLDTSSSIRDNIEALLELMGEAEFCWSGGVYKLSLIYPYIDDVPRTYDYLDLVQTNDNGSRDIWLSLSGSNTSTVGVGPLWRSVTIPVSDENFIIGEDISIEWPSANSRFNLVTVKFLNETNNFKEDTAVWPERAVYNEAGDHKGEWDPSLEYSSGDRVSYLGVDYKLINHTSHPWWHIYVENTNGVLSYAEGTPPSIRGQESLEFPESNKWLKSPLYDNQWISSVDSNTIYEQYRAEDNDMPLETEVFINGITTYQHAMAHAEQLCRASRHSATYSFALTPDFVVLEPGDVLKVDAPEAGITNTLIRVEEVSIKEQGFVKVSGRRYLSEILSWNAADDEPVYPVTSITTHIPQLENVSYENMNTEVDLSGGVLRWDGVEILGFRSYIVAYTVVPINEMTGGDINDPVTWITSDTLWTVIGETKNSFFHLPPLVEGAYVFTVYLDTAHGKSIKLNAAEHWPYVPANLGSVVMPVLDYVIVRAYLSYGVVANGSYVVPSRPVGGEYDPVTDTWLTAPSSAEGDWSLSEPPTGVPVYVSSGTIGIADGDTEVQTNVSWSTPVVLHPASVNVVVDASSVSVVAGLNQVGYDFNNATGSLRAFVGSTDVTDTTQATFSVVSYSPGLSISISNTGLDKGTFQVSASIGLISHATLRTVINGYTLDRVITVVATVVDIKTRPPLDIQGLEYHSNFDSVLFEWDYVLDSEYAKEYLGVNIYYNSVDDLETASSRIASGYSHNFHMPYVDSGDGSPVQYYFWFRPVSKWGVEGNVYPATSSILAGPLQPAESILQSIAGRLTSDAMEASLAAEIEKISGEGPGSVFERISEADFVDEHRLATAVGNIDAVTGKMLASAIASEVKERNASISFAVASIDPLSGIDLSAEVALAVNEIDMTASITTQLRALDLVNHTQMELLRQEIVNPDTGVITTRLAAEREDMSVIVTDIVTNNVSALTSDVSEILASKSVKIDQDGFVAGYDLIMNNDPERFSEMKFDVDMFTVASRSQTSASGITFAVDAINDQVVMSGASIERGSISHFQLGQGSVTTVKIEEGAVNNAKIGDFIESDGYSESTAGWHLSKRQGLILRGDGGAVIMQTPAMGAEGASPFAGMLDYNTALIQNGPPANADVSSPMIGIDINTNNSGEPAVGWAKLYGYDENGNKDYNVPPRLIIDGAVVEAEFVSNPATWYLIGGIPNITSLIVYNPSAFWGGTFSCFAAVFSVFTDDNGVQQVLYTVNGNGDIFSFHVTPLTDDMLIIGVLKGGTQPGWLKGDPLVAITSAEVWPQAKRLSARAHASTFIADLSVGTAQMGNLSVETLKIADEAVTVMRVVTSEVLISMVAIFSQYNYSYVVEGGLMYIFGDDFGSITLSNQHPTKPQYAVLDLSLEMFNEYENAKLLVCISEDPDKFPAWWADSYAEWTSAIVGAGMVQANKHYISDDANLIEWGGQNSSVHLRLLAPEETVTFYLYIVHHDAAMNLGNAEKGLAPKITLKGQVLAK